MTRCKAVGGLALPGIRASGDARRGRHGEPGAACGGDFAARSTTGGVKVADPSPRQPCPAPNVFAQYAAFQKFDRGAIRTVRRAENPPIRTVRWRESPTTLQPSYAERATIHE